MSPREGGEGELLRAVLFVALAIVAVSAFATTLAARAGDDIVNAVVLTPKLEPGGTAKVSFTLTRADSSADVLIIDSAGEQVRALQLDADLAAGRHELSWDGLADDGRRVPPGPYALRVLLGEQDRDILPPGRIRVLRGKASG